MKPLDIDGGSSPASATGAEGQAKAKTGAPKVTHGPLQMRDYLTDKFWNKHRFPTAQMHYSPADESVRLSVKSGDGAKKPERRAAKVIKAVFRNHQVDAVSAPTTRKSGSGIVQYFRMGKTYGGVMEETAYRTFIAGSAESQHAARSEPPKPGRVKRAGTWLVNKFNLKRNHAFRADAVAPGMRTVPQQFHTGHIETASGQVFRINGDGELMAHDPANPDEKTWQPCNAAGVPIAAKQAPGAPPLPPRQAPKQRHWSDLGRHADNRTYALFDQQRVVALDHANTPGMQVDFGEAGTVTAFTALPDSSILVLDGWQNLHAYRIADNDDGDGARTKAVGMPIPLALLDDQGNARSENGTPVQAGKMAAAADGRVFITGSDRQLYLLQPIKPGDTRAVAHPVVTDFSADAQVVDLALVHPRGTPSAAEPVTLHVVYAKPDGSVSNAYLEPGHATPPKDAKPGAATTDTGNVRFRAAYKLDGALSMAKVDGAAIHFEPLPGTSIVLNERAGLQLAVRNGGPDHANDGGNAGRLYLKRRDTDWEPTGVSGLRIVKVNPLGQYKAYALQGAAAGGRLVELDTSITQRYVAASAAGGDGSGAPALATQGGRSDVTWQALTAIDVDRYLDDGAGLVDFAVIEGDGPPSPPYRKLYTVDSRQCVRMFDLVAMERDPGLTPLVLGNLSADIGVISKIEVDRGNRVFVLASRDGEDPVIHQLIKLDQGGATMADTEWKPLNVIGSHDAPLLPNQKIAGIEVNEVGAMHVLIEDVPEHGGKVIGPFRLDLPTGRLMAPDSTDALQRLFDVAGPRHQYSSNLPVVHETIALGMTDISRRANVNRDQPKALRIANAAGQAIVDSARTTLSHVGGVASVPKTIARAVRQMNAGLKMLYPLYEQMRIQAQPLYNKTLPPLSLFPAVVGELAGASQRESGKILQTFDALTVDVLNVLKSIGQRSGLYDWRGEIDRNFVPKKNIPTLDPQHDLFNDVHAWLEPMLGQCLADPWLCPDPSERRTTLQFLRDRFNAIKDGQQHLYLHYPPDGTKKQRHLNDPTSLLSSRLLLDLNTLSGLGELVRQAANRRARHQAAGQPPEKTSWLEQKLAALKRAHYGNEIIDFTDWGFQDLKPLEATVETMKYFSNALGRPEHKLGRTYTQAYGVREPSDIQRRMAESLLTAQAKEINTLTSTVGAGLDPLAWFRDGGTYFLLGSAYRTRVYDWYRENIGDDPKSQPNLMVFEKSIKWSGEALFGTGATDPFVQLFRAGAWLEVSGYKDVTKGMMLRLPAQNVEAFAEIMSGRKRQPDGAAQPFDIRAVMRLCVGLESVRKHGHAWDATLHSFARFGMAGYNQYAHGAFSPIQRACLEMRVSGGVRSDRYDVHSHTPVDLGDGHTTILVSQGRERHDSRSITVNCFIGLTFRNYLQWPPEATAVNQFGMGFMNQNFLGANLAMVNRGGTKMEETARGKPMAEALAELPKIRKRDFDDRIAQGLPGQAAGIAGRKAALPPVDTDSEDEMPFLEGPVPPECDEAVLQWRAVLDDLRALLPEHDEYFTSRYGLIDDRHGFVAGMEKLIEDVAEWSPGKQGSIASTLQDGGHAEHAEKANRVEIAVLGLRNMKMVVDLAARQVPEILGTTREVRITNPAGLSSATFWEGLRESLAAQPQKQRLLDNLIELRKTDPVLRGMLDNLKLAQCTRFKIKTVMTPGSLLELKEKMSAVDKRTGLPLGWSDRQLSDFQATATYRISTIAGLVGNEKSHGFTGTPLVFLRSSTSAFHERSVGNIYFRYGMHETQPIAYEMTDAHIGEQKTVTDLGNALGMQATRLPAHYRFDPTVPVPDFAKRKVTSEGSAPSIASAVDGSDESDVDAIRPDPLP